MDRWYAQFTLFNEMDAIGSSYVCRIRDNSRYDIVEQRPLSEAARAAGVLEDAIVTLGATSPPTARPDHPIRLVLVKCTPHHKTGGRKGGTSGPPSDGILRIATNLLGPPAEIIAELYRQRWTIELFFRFLKHVLGCRHLLSTARVGIEIQTHMAIIACLLLALWTDGRPTLRTHEMVCLYLQGWAEEDELIAHLKKLKRQHACGSFLSQNAASLHAAHTSLRSPTGAPGSPMAMITSHHLNHPDATQKIDLQPASRTGVGTFKPRGRTSRYSRPGLRDGYLTYLVQPAAPVAEL